MIFLIRFGMVWVLPVASVICWVAPAAAVTATAVVVVIVAMIKIKQKHNPDIHRFILLLIFPPKTKKATKDPISLKLKEINGPSWLGNYNMSSVGRFCLQTKVGLFLLN